MKRILKPFLRMIRRIVGQHELQAELTIRDQILADIQTHLRIVERNLFNQINDVETRIMSRIDASELQFRKMVEAETNRLDGYIAYRLDVFRNIGNGSSEVR